jgi:hypothetical protein
MLLTLQNLQRNPEVLMCFGGTVTEYNTHTHTHTHKESIPLRDVLRFHFHDEIQKHLLTLQAPNPHCGIAHPCHCNWGGRKDQDQRLSVLVECSFASRAWKKINFISIFPDLVFKHLLWSFGLKYAKYAMLSMKL